MKRIFLLFFSMAALGMSGCIKNEIATFREAMIEFDAASWTANAAGKTFPIINRVPLVNAPSANVADNNAARLRRTTAPFTLRVNLLGPQSSAERTFTYQVLAEETTAVAGTHYQAFSGQGVIPANSSFGTITVTPLNPGPGTGSRVLTLQLTENSTFKVSKNYDKVGLNILQL